MLVFKASRQANFYRLGDGDGDNAGAVVRATGERLVIRSDDGLYQNVLDGAFTYDAFGNLDGGRIERIAFVLGEETAATIDARPPVPVETIADVYEDGSEQELYEALFAGSDQLFGSPTRDGLRGFAGDDVLRGGDGGDRLGGDAGRDTAAYDLSPTGVNVQLYSGTALFGDARGDRLADVENLLGSSFNDILAGDAGANALTGRAGADRLTGLGGNDVVRGGAGADRLDGGAGVDTAVYDTSGNGVNVQLHTGLTLYADAQGDRLFGVENLIGSRFDDTFSGDAGRNVLSGGAGNDTLRGLGGGDLLVGGPGADRLEGGGGRDVFRPGGGTGVDLITDFGPGRGGDVLDLRAVVDYGPGTYAPGDFVRLVATGADAILSVDPDGRAGGPGFVGLARLRGGGGLDLDALLADGNLLIA